MTKDGRVVGYELWWAIDSETNHVALVISAIEEGGQRSLVTTIEQGPFQDVTDVLEVALHEIHTHMLHQMS